MLNVEKGDKVILKGFTGIKLGVFEVAKATDKTVTVMKKDGSKMIFSKKTGKQTNVEEGKERYANSIMEDDGSYTAPERGKKKTSTKKASKKAKVEEPEEVVEEIEEYVEEEEPKKAKKKTSSKKTKKVEEEIEDFEDDDEFEDEFED